MNPMIGLIPLLLCALALVLILCPQKLWFGMRRLNERLGTPQAPALPPDWNRMRVLGAVMLPIAGLVLASFIGNFV